jgi:2-C-methyl-D-erythritol 4-phosphate cytidylyltransferase
LRRAHEGAPEATDDAALVEAIGGSVAVVPGEVRNRKITNAADLALVGAFLADSAAWETGTA